MKGYTVATGNIDLLKSKSRKAARFMGKQEGFVGCMPCPPHGTLWIYKTEADAKRARNIAEGEGIKCGSNICEVEFDDPKGGAK